MRSLGRISGSSLVHLPMQSKTNVGSRYSEPFPVKFYLRECRFLSPSSSLFNVWPPLLWFFFSNIRSKFVYLQHVCYLSSIHSAHVRRIWLFVLFNHLPTKLWWGCLLAIINSNKTTPFQFCFQSRQTLSFQPLLIHNLLLPVLEALQNFNTFLVTRDTKLDTILQMWELNEGKNHFPLPAGYTLCLSAWQCAVGLNSPESTLLTKVHQHTWPFSAKVFSSRITANISFCVGLFFPICRTSHCLC